MVAAVARAVPLAKAIVAALVACVVCAAVGLGVGAWLGSEWRKGREAQADNAVLRDQVGDYARQAGELRQLGLNIAQDFRTAHRRLESIVEGSTHDQATLDDYFDREREATAAWLETRLDLYGCRIGADGMRTWNAAATAGAATATAAEHPGDAAGAVPGEPAAAARGPRPGNGAGVSGEREGVPRVPVPAATHGGGGAQL